MRAFTKVSKSVETVHLVFLFFFFLSVWQHFGLTLQMKKFIFFLLYERLIHGLMFQNVKGAEEGLSDMDKIKRSIIFDQILPHPYFDNVFVAGMTADALIKY